MIDALLSTLMALLDADLDERVAFANLVNFFRVRAGSDRPKRTRARSSSSAAIASCCATLRNGSVDSPGNPRFEWSAMRRLASSSVMSRATLRSTHARPVRECWAERSQSSWTGREASPSIARDKEKFASERPRPLRATSAGQSVWRRTQTCPLRRRRPCPMFQ